MCCPIGYKECNGACCREDLCINGVCVDCASDSQCTSGHCVANKCQECIVDADCLNGQTCSSNVCSGGCDTAYQYKDNDVVKCCSNLVFDNMCCQTGYKGCNGTCCREDLCINGACVDCASDTDCANGQTCSSNVCSGACDTAYQYKDNDVVKCCSNLVFDNMCCQTGYKGCNGTCCREDLCINGACVDCASDTDCANGAVCVNGSCSSDVIKDCGGACTDNQTCVDTQCCAGLDNPECWNANNGGCCPTDTECTSAGCCSRACNGGCCLRGQTCVNDVCV
jgi:Cys-rich repeat protein